MLGDSEHGKRPPRDQYFSNDAHKGQHAARGINRKTIEDCPYSYRLFVLTDIVMKA